MTPFTLNIITPDAAPVTLNVTTLILRTAEGSMGILAGHQDGIFLLENDTISYETSSGLNYATCTDGVLHITGGQAELFCSKCVLS